MQQTTTVWQQGDYRSPRPARIETTGERTLMTATEYDYGPYNRVTETRECDFGGSIVLRRTRTEYEPGPGYLQRHILRLPRTVEVFDRSDPAPSARTEYVYDSQPLKDAPGVVAHLQTHNPYAPRVWIPPYDEVECDDAPKPRCRTIHHDGYWQSDYDPRTRLRGALTEIRRFADPGQRRDPVVERRSYDITGNLVAIESGRYDRAAREYSIATQYAYPERDTIGPADPAAQIAATTTYDFGTGLDLSTTDANGRTTTTQYWPARLRPNVVTWPTGATTIFTYEHHQQPVTETVHLADGSLAEQRRTQYNGLGLPRRTMILAAMSEADPSQPLYDTSECRYDALGRIWAQSSPYRTGDTPAWVEITRDALGRRTAIRAPDGSETRAYYDERAPRPDILADLDPALMGRTVRLVNAWGRERWAWHNALGQLQMSVEPNPEGDGSVLSPGTAVTYYNHNALGQVVQVIQRVPGSTPQNRRFRYDGLGRLTHQLLTERTATLDDAGQYRQPGSASQWSDVVAYTDASRPAWRMDARGVKMHFDYGDDPLGRLQSLTYEQSPVPPWVTDPGPRPSRPRPSTTPTPPPAIWPGSPASPPMT